MKAAVEQLPKAVTAALRAVAFRVSRSVYADAKQRLIAQQKTEARALANEIHVNERENAKAFDVVSDAPADQPANLPIWIEFGTIHMRARPYMRPALDAAQDGYKREVEFVSANAVTEALK